MRIDRGEPGERYFLAQDGSCHWYVIPLSKRAEWDAWRDLPDDDERSWDPPEWAAHFGGSPSRLTFVAPLLGGGS